jgi:hypothetical protein
MTHRRAFIPIFATLLIPIFSGAAASQTSREPTDNVLFFLPCHAWTEIHNDRSAQVVVENRTVEFIRQYAAQSVQALKKQGKELLKNADGADVDDRQIVNWVADSCAKYRDEPLAFVAAMLAAAFMLVANHAQLPPLPPP